MDLVEIDDLWRRRQEPEALVELERRRREAPDESDYDWLWRVSRLCQFQAMQALEAGCDSRLVADLYERGQQPAWQAMAIDSLGVEGHFWYGVTSIEAARQRGSIATWRALADANRHIERAMNIDEAYHFAGPLRVWGRITHLKPLMLGGSLDRALDILHHALQVAPDNSTNLLYYAETLVADQRWKPAREVLRQIIDAPDDVEWIWEQRRDRRRAAEWLDKLWPGQQGFGGESR